MTPFITSRTFTSRLRPPRSGRRDQRLNKLPFVIRQIARIAQLASVVALTVFSSPHRRPLQITAASLKSQRIQTIQELCERTLRSQGRCNRPADHGLKAGGSIWLDGEPKVRHYASAENALKALNKFETAGEKARAVYAQDRNTGNKLLAQQAWFVNDKGEVSAFLLKGEAEAWAKAHGGAVVDFDGARGTGFLR